jgi:hypothetical protein
MRNPSSSLRRTNAEERGLGNDGGICVEALQASGKRPVDSSEFFVHYCLKQQVAPKGEV